MKKLALFVISAIFLFFPLGKDVYAQINIQKLPRITVSSSGLPVDEIIVKFKEPPKTKTLLSVSQQNKNLTPKNGISSTNSMVFRIKDGNISSAIDSLAKNQNVASAYPNYKFRLLSIPNDPGVVITPEPGYPRIQWNLFNSKFVDSGMSAWDYMKDLNPAANPPVVVAVIDSGVNTTHPDLAGKFDKLADCSQVSCIDLTNNPQNMFDPVGHGTHVAGLVAAATNNGRGIASSGFHSKILVVKVTDNAGVTDISHTGNAVRWATDHGARVINLSLGAMEDNLDAGAKAEMETWVRYAWDHGAVVVAAAGNCGAANNDNNRDCLKNDGGYAINPKYYPAASANVISVAALRADNTITSYSEHGDWVLVAAGGGEYAADGHDAYNGIASTWIALPTPTPSGEPPPPYVYQYGTSMASPQVAGLAALIFTLRPAFTNSQVKNIIETSANHNIAAGMTKYGAINALAALQAVSAMTTVTPTPTVTLSPGSPTPTPTSTKPACSTVGGQCVGTVGLCSGGTINQDYNCGVWWCCIPSGPTSTPTRTPTPTITPYPTTGPAKLPKTPPGPYPSSPYCSDISSCPQKVNGDADCNNVINNSDYILWKSQYDTMVPPVPVNQNANFSCKEGDKNSYFIDLIDFEIWRRKKG